MEDFALASHRLPDMLPRLEGAPVCILGDSMLDEYLIGDAQRISPEAPVPVVLAVEERHVLGGAANVALNIRALGGMPVLVSLCGVDERAHRLRELLEQHDITYSLLGVPNRPTTLKTRILARNQQMLRIDREDSRPPDEATQDALLERLDTVLTQQNARILILSDYGKGIISPVFMGKLRAFLAARKEPVKLLVDPKTPNFHLYADAFLLTPNLKETQEGSGLPTGTREELLEAGRKIFADLGCEHLLTTLGPDGMALFLGPERVLHIPSAARKVFDVSGAGDTVIAVVALCLAAGFPLTDACLVANQAAGIVVGKVGTASLSPAELKGAVDAGKDLSAEYWKAPVF